MAACGTRQTLTASSKLKTDDTNSVAVDIPLSRANFKLVNGNLELDWPGVSAYTQMPFDGHFSLYDTSSSAGPAACDEVCVAAIIDAAQAHHGSVRASLIIERDRIPAGYYGRSDFNGDEFTVCLARKRERVTVDFRPFLRSINLPTNTYVNGIVFLDAQTIPGGTMPCLGI